MPSDKGKASAMIARSENHEVETTSAQYGVQRYVGVLSELSTRGAGKSNAGLDVRAASNDQQPRDSSGERSHGSGVVDFFCRRGRAPAGQPLLRALARTLRPLDVDLIRTLGSLGQHDHVLSVHLGEAADHRQAVLVAASPIQYN